MSLAGPLQALGRRVAGRLGHGSPLLRALRPAYEAVLNALALGRGVRVTLGGDTYLVDARHRFVFDPVNETRTGAFLREHVRPGAVCLNVGANIGLYALQLARRVGPAGRVIAFEPNPAACATLRRHVAMNGVGDRVRVVESAVSDRPGTAVLHAARETTMSRLGAPNPLGGGTSPVEVPVTTLDAFCDAEGVEPDWIFMDVEGFELAVLAGAAGVVRRRSNALGIVVEMHPAAWEVAGGSRAQAEATLAALGLVAVPISGQTDPLNDFGHVYLEPVAASVRGEPATIRSRA